MRTLYPLLRSHRPLPRLATSTVWPVLGAVLILSSAIAPAQSTWVEQTSNAQDLLGGVAHGNGTYVAVGDNGAIVNSPDGVTWSTASSGTAFALRSVIHNGAQFVAAGERGTVLTSPDGTTWTPQTTGVTTFLSGLAFGNGLYVAVGGGGGTILTSPDAINWTAAADSQRSGQFLQGVSFGIGLFVATGPSGTILTSPDGSTWTSRFSQTASFLIASGYFGGRHYAVGLNGTLVSSPDGASWTLGNSGTLDTLRCFTTDGTTAVVCGDDGALRTSTDGTIWSPAASGQSVILSGATFADGKFVVVGGEEGEGVVITSDQDPGIWWNSGAVSVHEADSSVTLTIDRIGPTTSTASVDFQTVQRTATPGIDFTASSGTANFAIGKSSVEVVITIANNPEVEPAEEFTVTLANPDPTGLLLYNPNVATVTIIDAQDSDADGLLDDWEILHFENVESFDADDDPDGDGNSNARELADDTDPDDINSALYLLTTGVASGLGTVTVSPDLAVYPSGTTVTLTPAATGEFVFVSWQGDASGAADPLVFDIASDLDIEALFEISLEDALDDPCLMWTVSGSGPAWMGQGVVTSDGADAAETGGQTMGQQSSIEAIVHGPAELSFQWMVSTSQFDTYRFFIDGSPRFTLSGNSGWQSGSFFIGAGSHTIRWTYSKNSTATNGSNQAWLDEVSLSYGFEDWQNAYFNTAELADPAISGPAGDPDLDGNDNLMAFLFDLNPNFPDPGTNLPVVSVVESGGDHFPAITWTQHRKRAENVTVTVQFSTTLEPGSWQTLTEPIELLSTVGGLETLRVTSPLPISSSTRGFFRLEVTLLPLVP